MGDEQNRQYTFSRWTRTPPASDSEAGQPQSGPGTEQMTTGFARQSYQPISTDNTSGHVYQNVAQTSSVQTTGMPIPRRTKEELYSMNLEALKGLARKEGDRTERQVQQLENRGYKKMWDTDENRWFPRRRPPFNRRRPILMPKSRRNFDQIKQYYQYRGRHPFRPTHTMRRASPQFRRSQQLLRRSRDILNRRQTDPNRDYWEKRNASILEKERSWKGMEGRQVHQKSQYMMNERNARQVRNLIAQRRRRALRGYRRSAMSSGNMPRVVKKLPNFLPAIEEEYEGEERPRINPIFPPSSPSSSSSCSTCSSSSDSTSGSDSDSSDSSDTSDEDFGISSE